MVLFLKMHTGFLPYNYWFSQAQDKVCFRLLSLTCSVALHLCKSCKTSRLGEDPAVRDWLGRGVRCNQGGFKAEEETPHTSWLPRPTRYSVPVLQLSTLFTSSAVVFTGHFHVRALYFMFETGGHCTDIYYAFQTFRIDFLNKHGFYEG